MTMIRNRTRPSRATWTRPTVQRATAQQATFRPTRLPRILWALASQRIDEAAASTSALVGVDLSYDELDAACRRGRSRTAAGLTVVARPSAQRGTFIIRTEAK